MVMRIPLQLDILIIIMINSPNINSFQDASTTATTNPNHKHYKYYSSGDRKLNIALVSDFYYPFVGGVQIHIKQLAIQLSKHPKIANVIVITHKYDHIPNRVQPHQTYIDVQNHHGFRVYYLNVHYNKQYMIIYPTFLLNFPKCARILQQQKINIVHCHQSGSTLSLEYIFFSKILNVRVLLTEHSLYGFRNLFDIHFNRVCRFFLELCDKVITVSRTTRNNLILRSGIQSGKVHVIPNGVKINNIWEIKKSRRQRLLRSRQLDNIQYNRMNKLVRIISVGRMTYRRGTDLLIQILPQLCSQHHNIQVLVIGDGVKRRALQKTIQKYRLHKTVKLLGIVSDHEKLLECMGQCDIFLNTPLTQSFGIALTEAAMLGLYCVSTDVGGIYQAVPSQLLYTSEVEPESLLQVISVVINKIRSKQKHQQQQLQSLQQKNKQHKSFEYKWQNVCQRTIQVYEHMMQEPKINRKQNICKAIKNANFFQIFFVILAVLIGFIHYFPFFL